MTRKQLVAVIEEQAEEYDILHANDFANDLADRLEEEFGIIDEEDEEEEEEF